ncbi:MAG: aminomethyltransferase family protein [Gammaproteobacteria bacterium]|nr:aminomethyltransferase family protein [Gammaproteobacteria bacterium]
MNITLQTPEQFARAPSPQLERRRVPAMGMLALPLFCGDEVEIVDPQGLQPALVAGFGAEGESRTAALGLAENANGGGARMAECLRGGAPGAARLAKKLRDHRIDLAAAKTCELLGGETRAGSTASFVCETYALGLICAPGNDMAADRVGGENPLAELPPGELIVFIRRAAPPPAGAAAELPDPLADPRADLRVKESTALAYEVAAGEYVQIIDVEGRQCSDFQCFGAANLERGRENCLDATTTRGLLGTAYPAPGLYSKFYDADFAPLVEVVQDTCGRHDSFGLACTAKYYDDAGYPGHVNCSDNFNLALANYPVTPRKGWMAMNLFFNTFFDDAHQFSFDDPWSRPGDYVLMRALTDLVCVSSACPCDINAANGWDPTDIHLRIYPRDNLFKRAVAYRKTTDAEPEMTKETGFHARTSRLTRNFTESNGYWLANDFTNLGAVAEYWACRESAAVIDLSSLRKAEITGPGAELLMQTCVTRDMRRLSPGQVVYTAMCHESGGMIDDGTVFRLAKDNFRWVGGSDDSVLWLRRQAEERGMHVWVKDSTEQLHNLQVQGPRSLDVLREIVWTRPDQAGAAELEWFRFSIARIGGEDGIPIVLSRTGYTGERGYEIFCHPKHAGEVWDAVWQAGQPHDIKPLGLAALDMLRIEAGLIFAGHEFTDQTDPFEAGIGFTVPLKSKQDDFIGRAALTKRKDAPRRKLVGLVLSGEEPAAHGDGIYTGRTQIGEVTSGALSPILRKNIALARVDVEHAALGGKLEVGKLDGHQKRIACEVVEFPHFDAGKKRVRGVE